MNKAFFLDRDGTLNVDYNYVHQPKEWTWCEGAIKALKWIQQHDFKIIVITNQSGITRGRYTVGEVNRLHDWVDEQLQEYEVQIDGWYFAAHHPEHDPDKKYNPDHRKPGTGLFEQAAREHDVDFSRSFMAGDKITDLQPAVELGITPLFIESRHAPKQDEHWLEHHNIRRYGSLWDGVRKIKLK